jgi:hypothetical protein
MEGLVIALVSSRPTDEDFQKKCGVYLTALSDIPTGRLEDVFSMATKQCRFFPKPIEMLNLWQNIKHEEQSWREKEETRFQDKKISDNPADYPTPEEHVAAIKIINAVSQGKFGSVEGREFLNGVFNGQLSAAQVAGRL